VPKSEWIVVDGAIPVIICEEQFAAVQTALQKFAKSRSIKNKDDGAIFARKIKCAECGRNMVYHSLKAGRVYLCSMHTRSDNFDCQTGRIEENAIYDAVLAALQTHLTTTKEKRAPQKETAKPALASKEPPCNKIRTLQLTVKKTNVSKAALWEEFNNGLITLEAFRSKNGKLSEQIAQHEKNISLLEAEARKSKTLSKDNNSLSKLYNEPNDITELNKGLVGKLIKDIKIYAPKRIEIVWSFRDPFAPLSKNSSYADE
jgi:hypothetical protein